MFDGFDWRSLGKVTIADVAGSYKSVAVGVAQRFQAFH